MKRILSLLLAGTLLLTCGCSLAKPEEELQDNSPMEDSLIGVLITTEYLDLFDMDAWLNDNIGALSKGGETVIDGDTSQYQGRIYAERTDEIWYSNDGEAHNRVDYKFPEELNGYALMSPMIESENYEPYLSTIKEAIFADAKSHVKVTDWGTAVELTATIYYDPLAIPKESITELHEDGSETLGNHIAFYHNPIYQTPEGDVYVTSGSGTAHSGGPGVSWYGNQGSYTISQTQSTNFGGESQVLESYVEISMHAVRTAEKIVINEMSADNMLLRTVEYSHEDFPRELTVGSDTSYAVIETHNLTDDGEVFISRQICTADNEEESFTVFVPLENGYVAKQQTKVVRE